MNITNSIFAEQAKGIDIEYREDGGGSSTAQCSYSQWADAGILKLGNNIFQNVADGTAAGIFKVVSEKDDSDVDLFTVPAAASTDFAAYFETAGNEVSDVGVDADESDCQWKYTGSSLRGLDEWFIRSDFRGAFKPNENWAKGWTLSLGEVNAKSNPFTSFEKKMATLNRVSIYPNPVLEFATVEFESGLELHTPLHFYDMAGRTVRVVSNIYNGSFQIERGKLNDGLYLYRLTNENGIVAEGKTGL